MDNAYLESGGCLMCAGIGNLSAIRLRRTSLATADFRRESCLKPEVRACHGQEATCALLFGFRNKTDLVSTWRGTRLEYLDKPERCSLRGRVGANLDVRRTKM